LPAASLTRGDYAEFGQRLALDVAALLVLGGLLYLRRHPHRRDMLLVFCMFNVGVFAVLAVITEKKIPAAVGFGLFALLSIIRLRSQPYGNVELAYFFSSLAIGVVNGIGHLDLGFKAVVCALVLVAMGVLDHPRLQPPVQRRRVVLDGIHTDVAALRGDLERRQGVKILELRISDVDYVRETTAVTIRYLDPAAPREAGLLALEDDMGEGGAA